LPKEFVDLLTCFITAPRQELRNAGYNRNDEAQDYYVGYTCSMHGEEMTALIFRWESRRKETNRKI
jgi:hypothetical protein